MLMDQLHDQLWTHDISLLYRGPRIKQLVPTRFMTFEERVNAIVRLVILTSCLVYVFNRDGRYLLYGGFCVLVITLVAGLRPSKLPRLLSRPTTVAPQRGYACTHPTPNNPFANVLIGDSPDKPPACDVDAVSDEIQRTYGAGIYRDLDDVGYKKSGITSFHTMPDTSSWQAGREAFAKSCYGSQPTCKENQGYCGF